MENEAKGFSQEQKDSIERLLPAYFATELAKWMSQHQDKATTHTPVKYPDETVETSAGITFRQRYVLMPNEELGKGVTLLPFEVEAESFPHTTLSVTIENSR